MGKITYAMGVTTSVHVRTMGEGIKFLLFWCVFSNHDILIPAPRLLNFGKNSKILRNYETIALLIRSFKFELTNHTIVQKFHFRVLYIPLHLFIHSVFFLQLMAITSSTLTFYCVVTLTFYCVIPPYPLFRTFFTPAFPQHFGIFPSIKFRTIS